MKKLILSAAALALVVSCSKNEVVDIPSTQSNAIGFSTLNDRVTKAANDDASNYMVYALSSASTAAWYINGEAVSSSDAIVSGVDYYWPTSTATLDFFAYAPSATTATGAVLTKDTDDAVGAVNLTYTVGTAASEDFTVATPITGATSTYQGGGTTDATLTAVPLVFSHMLAKATISVTLSTALIEDGYTFALTSAGFNVVNNKVTVAAHTAATATAGAGAASYAYTFATTTTTDVTGEQALLFAPHTATEYCSIDLNDLAIYNTNGVEVYPATKTTYAFGGDTNANETQAFVSGTSYTITITIDLTDPEVGAKPIVLKSDIVTNPWGTATTTALSAK